MMTKTVSVKDAQAQFLELLDLVSMGNRVVIEKDEEPLSGKRGSENNYSAGFI
ncbi:MAG: hypothetical protein PVH61_31095 [Candidatus Aminicenantes bacterium]|jgi:hypothetical protein